jgi:uncharacterized protein YacL
MRINRILRLILAVVFALIAFIFSEIVPDIPPIHRNVLRFAITLWFGLLGYGLFPDIARAITTYTMNGVNALTMRISNEVMNQMMRIPRPQNFSVPYPSNAPISGVSMNQPMILDTSAIIDGRILDIAKTGFLYGTILIPASVLTELQQVSDSADYIKRSRGRKGFETIEELKKVKGIRIEVWDKEPAAKTVDDKIIKMGKNLHGRIITTDFNLNRVASVSNVTVLNINDLANAVKAVAIPGETLKIKVVHIGKDPNQGVGYLQDGTMVVVENGAALVGSDVKTEVTRLIQGSAGRMIFTKSLKS